MVSRGPALIGATLALALGCLAGPAAASTITWSAPALIDQRLPFAVPEGITDLSCPSVHLCVGTQASGVEISRHPLVGASAWAITALPVTPGFPLDAISCASPRLCVAVNYRGQVFTSTDPAGGAAAWRGANVAALAEVSTFSCPRVRFCIALEGRNVAVSTNPTRPSSWRVIAVSSSDPFASVACPSRRLCVGTMPDNLYGGITWTTSPSGPGWDWKTIYPGEDFSRRSVACPSTRLCVAIGTGGDLFTSTHPARGRWKPGRLPGAGPPGLAGTDQGSLSCPSVRLCVWVSPHGVAVSTHPAGGAHTWRLSGQPSTVPVTEALSCPSVKLCVATLGDLVFSTPHPADGAGTWRSSYLHQGYNPLSAIACPSDQLCVGIDGGGNLITSSAPAASATAWNVAPLGIGPQTSSMRSLTCPSVAWCAATTTSGTLITSADPANAGAWSATARGINDVSCPTVSFCAGSDGNGAIHTSGSPGGGAAAWSSQQVATAPQCERQYCNYDALTAVSCPSANLCATTDGQYLWVSTAPAAVGAPWTKSALPNRVEKLYCPTGSLCLAASGAALEATTDPADPVPQWTTMNLPQIALPATFGPAFAPQISGISCVSAHLCVAVDSQGGYAFVGDPADPQSWSDTKLDYSAPVPVLLPGSLTSVSCTPSGRCVATDGRGNVLVGIASG